MFFHPYLGKIPILTNILQRGRNHQVVINMVFLFTLLTCVYVLKNLCHFMWLLFLSIWWQKSNQKLTLSGALVMFTPHAPKSGHRAVDKHLAPVETVETHGWSMGDLPISGCWVIPHLSCKLQIPVLDAGWCLCATIMKTYDVHSIWYIMAPWFAHTNLTSV